MFKFKTRLWVRFQTKLLKDIIIKLSPRAMVETCLKGWAAQVLGLQRKTWLKTWVYSLQMPRLEIYYRIRPTEGTVMMNLTSITWINRIPKNNLNQLYLPIQGKTLLVARITQVQITAITTITCMAFSLRPRSLISIKDQTAEKTDLKWRLRPTPQRANRTRRRTVGAAEKDLSLQSQWICLS